MNFVFSFLWPPAQFIFSRQQWYIYFYTVICSLQNTILYVIVMSWWWGWFIKSLIAESMRMQQHGHSPSELTSLGLIENGLPQFCKEVFQIQGGTENLMAKVFSVFNYTSKDIKCSYRRKILHLRSSSFW